MSDLPSLDDLYPHTVLVKHRGQPAAMGLKVIRWLEAQGILTNADFFFDMSYDADRVAFSFRKKKYARLLKVNKKQVLDA